MQFLIHIITSFIVGGIYVASIVWASEKFGAKIGATLAGLPSTILVGAIFISLDAGPYAAKEALTIVPLMFIATLIFAYTYYYLISKKYTALRPYLLHL